MDITSVKRFSKKRLKDDPTGHDYYHCVRVANLAKKILKMEDDTSNKDAQLVEIMSYLHDTIDEKICENIPKTINEIAELLNQLGLSGDDKNNIMFTIQNMSYSKNLKTRITLSNLGNCVQDADRLDALGAIGIARAFAYGGHKNQLIYDPNISFVSNITDYKEYRTHKTTTINHFYEKLLNLHKYMNTYSGTMIAKKRTKYMLDFLNEFKEEWG